MSWGRSLGVRPPAYPRERDQRDQTDQTYSIARPLDRIFARSSVKPPGATEAARWKLPGAMTSIHTLPPGVSHVTASSTVTPGNLQLSPGTSQLPARSSVKLQWGAEGRLNRY